jgi:hypothetical protein
MPQFLSLSRTSIVSEVFLLLNAKVWPCQWDVALF